MGASGRWSLEKRKALPKGVGKIVLHFFSFLLLFCSVFLCFPDCLHLYAQSLIIDYAPYAPGQLLTARDPASLDAVSTGPHAPSLSAYLWL